MNRDRDPVVVLSADEKFAMPLAVTVRSVLEHLDSSRKLRVYVMDGGLSDTSKNRLLKSWPVGRYEVTWITVDNATVANLPIAGTKHINHTCYYRILMPWLLPSDVIRGIHLDADVIACRDLGRLWDTDMQGSPCLAAQDISAPYVDSQVALANFDRCGQHLGCVRPIPNYRELGLDPRSQYFNAGILLVDFAAWRNDDLPSQFLACLEKNRSHVFWNDQYALNVVLAGRWRNMDPRWNQGSHIYKYPGWDESPVDRQSYNEQHDDPFLVHFTTSQKPWCASCHHPLRQKFFDCVERTDWAGFRLSRIDRFMEAMKTQERRFRHGRRRLFQQARSLWQPALGQS